MSDSNSRLVYSTDSGRIDEPKAVQALSERGRYRTYPAPDQWAQGEGRVSD